MVTKSLFSWRGLILMAFCGAVVVGSLFYRNLARVDGTLVEWREVVSVEGNYRVDVLATPQGVSTVSLNGKTGHYGVAGMLSKDGPVTIVKCNAAPDVIGIHDAPAALEALQRSLESQLTNGGRVVSTTNATFGTWPARHCIAEVSADGGSTRVEFRYGRTSDRYFVLSYIATNKLAREELADRFFNSFEILPSEVEQALVVEKAPTELPPSPFDLPPPPLPDSMLNSHDLTKVDSRSLFAASNKARREGEIQKMVQLQHWGVVAEETSGLYNLACCYGIAEDADAALYWLQRAAVVEGVDAQHASTDYDLSSVRGDKRWAPVLRYLAECGAYWRTQRIQQIETILPEGYANEPIPVLIGLHGIGHNATGFVDGDYYQTLANDSNYAVVAVSGTQPSGPNSFGWAEDMTLDHAQIQDALRSLKGRLTPKKGAVVLFGFSQGGAVAAGLTAHYPDAYAGAIGLSSGTRGKLPPPTSPMNEVKRTRNVMVCGAREHPSTVATTKQWADWFAEQGAETKHKVYPDQQSHTDFRN